MLLASSYRFGVVPPSEAAGNLLTSGNKDFSSGWNDVFGTGTTLTANAETNPLGTASAAGRFVEASGFTWQSRGVTFGKAASSIEYWASIYVKVHAGSRLLQCELGSTDGNNGCGFSINLINGTGAAVNSGYNYGSGFTHTVGSQFSRQLANGWWQLGTRLTIGSGQTLPLFAIYIHNGSTSNFTGDGASGLKLWRPRIALIADGYL